MGVISAALPLLGLSAREDAANGPQAQEDDAPDTNGQLVTFGTHQYFTADIGHPAESALATSPSGSAFVCDSSGVQRTTDGGQTWGHIGLLPPNLVIGIIPEGDVIVAPNGDVLTNWLAINEPHTAPVWKSKNDGQSYTIKPTGPMPVPDRPWIMVSALVPPDPSNPLQGSPYLGAMIGGIGVKLTWASRDGGETWVMPTSSIPGTTTTAAFPALTANPYMDYAKPFGQGLSSTRFVALPGGQVYDVPAKRWTTDFVHWTVHNNPGAMLNNNDYAYWDVSSTGHIYAARIAEVNNQWRLQYAWFDGAWHDGAIEVPLAAKPDYLIGLTPVHVSLAAIKSHGDMLGINTREGNQDVLVRIQNAHTATPTWTKDSIGAGSVDRYDFPNLAFDAQGRAVVSYESSKVAYATTA